MAQPVEISVYLKKNVEGLKPPQPFNFEGNSSENWKKFKQKYDIFFEASELNKKDPEI